jgi:hypothetical protein
MRTLVVLLSTVALHGCDYHRPLGNTLKPQPTSPLPGAGTGNANSGSTPTLTWNPANEADSYEVQVDDSCQIGIPCDFPSPEIDVFVTDPYYVPVTPLSVSSTGPRRQTYCWRVRGCHQNTCGEWSDPRCFVVGADKTLNRDLNGDGFADLVVGAPRYTTGQSEEGRAAVYLGGAKLPERAALVHPGAPYVPVGRSVATVGDVNGDGYGDYVLTTGADYSNLNGNGMPATLQVFFGGTVLKPQPDVTLREPTQQYEFAQALGCGDLNGDGYDDIVALVYKYPDPGSVGPTEGPWVKVYFGGPSLAASAPLVMLGTDAAHLLVSAAAAGDVNGDGHPDLLVAFLASSNDAGGAYLFYGGPAMDAEADVEIPWPDLVPGSYPVVAGLGDVNGDGFADVALGVPSSPVIGVQQGSVRIFFGGAAPHTTADLTLPEDFGGERFAVGILPAGDLDHDGYADFAVLSTGTVYLVNNDDGHGQTSRVYPGKASLFAGGPAPAASSFATVSAPSDHAYVLAGSMVDLDGDGVPEILLGEWNDSGSSLTQLTQVAIYRASNGYAAPARVLPGFKAGDDFGIAISQ